MQMELQPQTMSTEFEVQHIADPDIDHSEETLVSSLEFTLVEDLHGDDRRVLDSTRRERRERGELVQFQVEQI